MVPIPRPSRPFQPLGQTTMLSERTTLALSRSRRSGGESPRARRRPDWRRALLRRAVGLIALALPYAAWAELPAAWLPFAPPVDLVAD